MNHCEDCLAYYPPGYNHVCPPWLKFLVSKYKKTGNINNREGLITLSEQKDFVYMEMPKEHEDKRPS